MPGGISGVLLLAAVVVVVVVAVRTRLGRLPVPDLFADRRPGSRPGTAAELRAAADRLAGERRWADAVRLRARAAVRALEARGLVEATPGRTVPMLARQAAARLPGADPELRVLVQVVDEIWYARVPATEATYRRLRDADLRLEAATAIAP